MHCIKKLHYITDTLYADCKIEVAIEMAFNCKIHETDAFMTKLGSVRFVHIPHFAAGRIADLGGSY